MISMFDTCSGIGGFSLAASWTGEIETTCFVEPEPFCQAVLRKHWPDVPIIDRIEEINGQSLSDRGIAKPFIITGGIPCQPASVAGQRKGEADDRWLWDEFLRLVSELRPVWVLAENVPGIASIKGKNLDWILGELEASGYEAQTFLISAANLGAPHLRERVWIVAKDADKSRFQPSAHSPGDNFGDGCLTKTGGASAIRTAIGERGRCLQAGTDYRSVAHSESAELNGGSDTRRRQSRLANGRFAHAYADDKRKSQSEGIVGEIGRRLANGIEQVSAYSNSGQREQQAGQLAGRGSAFTQEASRIGDVAYSNSSGWGEQRRSFSGGEFLSSSQFDCWSEEWPSAASRLCYVDDGLPGGLSKSERNTIYRAVKYFGREEVERQTGLNLSKVDSYRVAGLKAGGNSIVPQIAYLFLQAIVDIERAGK